MMSSLAGEGMHSVDAVSRSLIEAIETGPGQVSIKEFSLSWLPWNAWDLASQGALRAEVNEMPGATPGAFFFYFGQSKALQVRKPAAAADLRYDCGGRVVRLGSFAAVASDINPSKVKLLEAIQRQN